MEQNNHCCKVLHAGISFLGIGAWLMLIGISLITASLAYDPAIHGKTAEVLRLLWVITMAGTLSLRIMSVQRHMMLALRFRKMPILPRFGCLLLATLLPPVPEVMGIAKLGFRKSVVVQNFWCDAPNVEVDATKLAENVRSRYFAKAVTGEPELVVATNFGLLNILLEGSSLYAFLLEEQWEGQKPFGVPEGSMQWRLEESHGNRALVWEVRYTPCCQPRAVGQLEQEVSELLLAAIDDLTSVTR